MDVHSEVTVFTYTLSLTEKDSIMQTILRTIESLDYGLSFSRLLSAFLLLLFLDPESVEFPGVA